MNGDCNLYFLRTAFPCQWYRSAILAPANRKSFTADVSHNEEIEAKNIQNIYNTASAMVFAPYYTIEYCVFTATQ